MGKPLDIESGNAKPLRVKPRAAEPNLRDQQRVDVKLPVTLNRPGQAVIECEICNLSRSGMLIRCTGKVTDVLMPGRRTPAPGDWIDVTARFEVPVIARQTISLAARCHIAHLRRIARDEFHLGIRFVDFEGRGFDYVDQYVHRLMADRIV
ncbi:PilZ domain-containing protein [Marinobacter daqiaonensis]|uniref:PilZ domain-containing protein n=1 Tax=Marinobacter daqiaonensis TaxID=650891 RepID=A0A1I6HCB8_9GAMM|nr:PilZ domain-containing protein [Marinobacter daqiaonensis]SFR52112.1 PilZ domain-containing protein [Marinobacter daqiaonensis]